MVTFPAPEKHRASHLQRKPNISCRGRLDIGHIGPSCGERTPGRDTPVMLPSVRPLLDPPGCWTRGCVLGLGRSVREGALGGHGAPRSFQGLTCVMKLCFSSLYFLLGIWLPFSIFPATPVLSSRYLLAIYFSVFGFWFLFFRVRQGTCQGGN